jgi:IS5 family transposase
VDTKEFDPRTGRPLDESGLPTVAGLSDAELEAELTTAASAPDHKRFDRFADLLRERARRRAFATGA